MSHYLLNERERYFHGQKINPRKWIEAYTTVNLNLFSEEHANNLHQFYLELTALVYKVSRKGRFIVYETLLTTTAIPFSEIKNIRHYKGTTFLDIVFEGDTAPMNYEFPHKTTQEEMTNVLDLLYMTGKSTEIDLSHYFLLDES